MATTVRQPFAPLDSYRLKTLTSLKNRQNAISSSSPTKRKADSFDLDNDTENIDPTFSTSPKKSRGVDGCTSTIFKPSKFVLTAAPPSPNEDSSIFKPSCLSPSSRPILTARSPLRSKLSSQKMPLSTPAGRSPTRKRVGIMNKWKASSNSASSSFVGGGPSPAFTSSLGGSSSGKGGLHLPFTIDAALKGTIPSYGRRGINKSSSTTKNSSSPTNKYSTTTTTLYPTTSIHNTSIPSNTTSTSVQTTTTTNMSPTKTQIDIMLSIPELYHPEPKSSWFFDIHEDTAEEENTNLMYHSTLTLDISSDEESAARHVDLRGKENVPPMNDRDQVQVADEGQGAGFGFDGAGVGVGEVDVGGGARNANAKARLGIEKMDIDRAPLGDLCAEEYYPKGLDAGSTFVILEDDLYEVIGEGIGVLVGGGGGGDDGVRDVDLVKKEGGVEVKGMDGVAEFKDKKGKGVDRSVEEIMKGNGGGAKARVLEPMEKAEEGFAIWESDSADGEEEG